ncbi:PDZ domain-containing protein [Coleofasciculus sp. FACHB-64]|uniref:carboxyl-terminal processing protease CtpA n=1 Tax=Cyanophyceae TaxID=3028117 RepID=UPI0016876C55|nr:MULTISPECIES: carboxyl-terminal processing protease CtpA [unclassified Coleofasciculus]MBD1895998.1 PDZ domain-containing protein [Coleofasciculus sp. FACHB-129]MBD1902178.1 PDZ domain-containing protein [Coleofasciculus sp. FACHB-125]MBD2045195.1 PDZ domain-containing protein [Coleofasciculus sp. FACHB-64]MBD2083829.1 PDZ domain-containing protein [Coleofasciculus sp. FACHB-542]MBD2538839.1 PDZ domain-containing protein [Coleofasciculus sp. FACHB-SPT36]
MHKRVLRVVFVLIIQTIFTLSWWTSPAIALTEEQQLLSEAWRIVNYAYVDDSFNQQNWWMARQKAIKQPLSNREATYTAIQNMLKTLEDPFTRFLKPDQYRSLQVNTSGELQGVGLQIALDAETGELQVVAPIDGSPAAKAGIRSRDRILEIDGIQSAQLTLDEAAARMRGAAGTEVRLLMQRETKTPEEITLVRSRIALNPVYAVLDSSSSRLPVGYIRLSQFSANAPTELANAVTKLEKQGAQAYLLDLRNNPGGLLQAGIEIARMWLDEGTIVYTVNRQGILGSFEASAPALTHAPLVVLVNQGSASASEILAGALQDNGRAQLVGARTFGKGLIQSLFDLSDGSGLAVTVAKYETPNHHDINKLGITPDREVPLEPITLDQVGTEADQQYKTALEVLTANAVVADAA